MDQPLTDPQRVLAKVYLKRYLESCFPLGLDFKLYTFRSFTTVVTPANNPLTGAGSRPRLHPTADRRSSGALKDPTGDAVVQICDGVEVTRRESISVTAAQIAELVGMLPSHLELVVDLCYKQHTKQEVVAARLDVSHSTVSRRLNEAVTELCSLLYGSRWSGLASLAPTTVDDYPLPVAGDDSILLRVVSPAS